MLQTMLKKGHSRPLAGGRGWESASLSTGLVPSHDRQGAVLRFFQHALQLAQPSARAAVCYRRRRQRAPRASSPAPSRAVVDGSGITPPSDHSVCQDTMSCVSFNPPVAAVKPM